ncbi:MAG: hypothetical protein ACM36C_04010, partial [Acidobacteriota bacterium]
ADPALFEQIRTEAARKLATLPAFSKAVLADRGGLGATIRDAVVQRGRAMVAALGNGRHQRSG